MGNRVLIPFAVLIFAFLCLVLFVYAPKAEGDIITVNKDGKIIEVIKLSDIENPYTIELGGNTIYAEKDGVSMSYADCPDKLCVRQGKIKSGAIICLPNRVTVEFKKKQSGIDAVAGAR